MKKRICAIFCVLLMLACFTCSVSAFIVIEDETGTRYSDETSVSTTAPTTTKPNAVSVAAKKAAESLSVFWRRFGFLTVVLVLIVGIVTAIVISEFERQKKEQRPKQTHSKKKK